MKKLVLVAFVLLVSVMVLVGCKHEVEAQHEHTFGEWEVKETATATGAKQVVEVCTECGYAQEVVDFVYIPAGKFQMGSKAGDSDSKPVHEVEIRKGFFMGKCEVTQKEYLEVMGKWGSTEPSEEYGKGDKNPAYCVSWYDAVVYCNKRSIAEKLEPVYKKGDETDPAEWGEIPNKSDAEWNNITCDWDANGYRLPTEAEWEYAARGGNSTTEKLIWSGTDKEKELGNYAWYWMNSDNKNHEVGMKDPNKYGLCDMSGNVSEWCWDWYADDYYSQTESGSDPKGASSGDHRVSRGGSWSIGANFSDDASVSFRSRDDPYGRYEHLGFRVVRASSK